MLHALLIAGGLFLALAALRCLVSPNYVPSRDADLLAWADNFNALITADPARYGLVAGDAVAIDNAVTPFDDAYALGGGTYHSPVNPATKTVVTTQAKNDAKTAMLAIIRPYAQQIAISPGVSSDDKIALGLNARTNTPTPIPTPTSFPLISLRGLTPLGVTLQWQDSALGTGKRKPDGALQADVRAGTSTTVVTDPSSLPLIGLFTKSPFGLAFDSVDGGKTLYYCARWVTRTGKFGPWSVIGATTVPIAG
jgi:hypothetical protein